MPIKIFIGSGIPSGDDFSNGIGDWTEYVTDADASMDWYQSDSLRFVINTGITSERDIIKAIWTYALSGDFDIEVEYLRLSQGSIGAGRNADLGFFVTPSHAQRETDFISISNIADKANMRSVYELGDVTQDSTDNTSKPNPTLANLRLRITRIGTTFTTYHDPSTGSWSQVAQHSAPSFSGDMYPGFTSFRFGTTSISGKYDNFLVN